MCAGYECQNKPFLVMEDLSCKISPPFTHNKYVHLYHVVSLSPIRMLVTALPIIVQHWHS